MRSLSHFLNRSLIVRTGFAMATLVFVAILTASSSGIIATRLEGHAEAINQAGSIRKRAYQISAELLKNKMGAEQATLQANITFLANEQLTKLKSNTITKVISFNTQHYTYQLYQKLLLMWTQEMAPAISRQDLPQYTAKVDGFVNLADELVELIQLDAEDRILQLQIIQAICLSLSIFIVFIALFDIKTNVVHPLRALVNAAKQARQGDFSYRVKVENPDELGLLSETFNVMAEDLSSLYENLEELVRQKTKELQTSNQSLQFLYGTAKALNQELNIESSIQNALERLNNTLQFNSITLLLNENYEPRFTQVFKASENRTHSICNNQNCKICDALRQGKAPDTSSNIIVFPLGEKQKNYGRLFAEPESGSIINSWQNQILTATAESIATQISLSQQLIQEKRIALMEERTAIARELHDSLAQALSYLKIQVTRLKMLRAKKASEENIEDVINELGTGLNSAYRQLRELLTTFRLNIDTPTLEIAIQETVQEFNERDGSKVVIKLDCRLQEFKLSPNQEVHVLQIIREALSNILRHAQASKASVSLKIKADSYVSVIIDDDGTGISQDPEKPTHYGLTIMRERASNLGGNITLSKISEKGGTRVALLFPGNL